MAKNKAINITGYDLFLVVRNGNIVGIHQTLEKLNKDLIDRDVMYAKDKQYNVYACREVEVTECRPLVTFACKVNQNA